MKHDDRGLKIFFLIYLSLLFVSSNVFAGGHEQDRKHEEKPPEVNQCEPESDTPEPPQKEEPKEVTPPPPPPESPQTPETPPISNVTPKKHHKSHSTRIKPVCLKIENVSTSVDSGIIGDGKVDFHFNIKNADTVLIMYGPSLTSMNQLVISTNDGIEVIPNLSTGHYWFTALGVSSCTIGLFTSPLDP